MIIIGVEMWILILVKIWKYELSILINKQMWTMLILSNGF